MDKRSHFGMAGHYAAMSRFLGRGYNVAVPAVDVGDDIFVVEDPDGVLRRVQVKSSNLKGNVAQFTIARAQLEVPRRAPLFYMFMAPTSAHAWSAVLISRADLNARRAAFEQSTTTTSRRGPKPRTDGPTINLKITFASNDATCWGESLKPYLDQWTSDWPAISGGPGAVTKKKP